MPDRTPAAPYEGPERRRRHRRAEDRPPVRHWLFTTWQWAVIATLMVSVILSASVGWLARRADENAQHGNAAICVEVAFLENGARTMRAVIAQNPGAPENAAREASARNLERLIRSLQASVPSCHEALK